MTLPPNHGATNAKCVMSPICGAIASVGRFLKALSRSVGLKRRNDCVLMFGSLWQQELERSRENKYGPPMTFEYGSMRREIGDGKIIWSTSQKND